jgi:hypothetical protein
MERTISCQGRQIKEADLDWIKSLIEKNPQWSRHSITKHICEQWDWRSHKGQLKTFAARSFIDKLEQRGLLELPPIRTCFRRKARPVYPQGYQPPVSANIECKLKQLRPLSIQIPNLLSSDDASFGYYLKHHHYLGFNCTVGENIKYLVKDRYERIVACLLFGSAAWKTIDRDLFIGWEPAIRENNINYLTNNTRFLILPWVKVPYLASHILGLITSRIQQDWVDKYAHPVHLLETFVECQRFKGSCYKAANWIRVGQTKGRSRQDQFKKRKVPIKDTYLYPLTLHYKQVLCQKI